MSDTTAPPRVWHTHTCCRAHDGQPMYANFGTPQRLRMCHPSDDVVPVTLTEDPGGSHWGWITTGHDEPELIQPTRHQFAVQFPYGYEAEQQWGRGRMVRLRVEEATR